MARTHSATDGSRPTANQTTIAGILVHVFGMFLGFVGAGLVFLASTAPFTRANAQNAVNWHVFAFGTGFVAVALAFGLGAISDVFVIIGAAIGVTVAFLNIIFCLWATVKAIRGEEREYPLAPTVITSSTQ